MIRESVILAALAIGVRWRAGSSGDRPAREIQDDPAEGWTLSPLPPAGAERADCPYVPSPSSCPSEAASIVLSVRHQRLGLGRSSRSRHTKPYRA